MNENKSKKQWTAEDVIAIQNLIATLNVRSLNEIITDGDSTGKTFGELGDFIEDIRPGPQELIEDNELREFLLKYVRKLPPHQRVVIEQRFGLIDRKPKTLDETGKLFNVTRERIRQLEEQGLKRLKWFLIAKGKYKEFEGGE